MIAPTRELADQVASNTSRSYAAQHSKLRVAGRLRRHRHEAADAGAQGWCRSAHRHAGPPAGPHRSEERECSTRSSTWCSTKPTACSTSASCPTCSASCQLPAERRVRRCSVLGDLLTRNQKAFGRELLCRTRSSSRSLGPTRLRPTSSSVSTAVADRRQARRRSCQLIKDARAHAGASFSSIRSWVAARLARSFEREGLADERVAR